MRIPVIAMMLGVAAVLGGAAQAAEHEVLMLNRGEKGAMVFEPDFVRAEPGDTIRFVATDRGHNAEAIRGMVPDGAQVFKGKMNEEIVVRLETPGVYGIKCAPHYGMGMVALVIVGEALNADAAREVKHPGKAKTVFSALFGEAVAAS